MGDEHLILELGDVVSLHNGVVPLYHSLGQLIRARIQSGEWHVGQRISSERDLMRMFGVSRTTVRQGIENLVKEGVLQRIRGKGTYVAPPKIKQGLLRLGDFADTMTRSGLIPSARLLGKGAVLPPLNIQQALHLGPAARVVWLQRLWLVNEFPMMIETLYLPAGRFSGLLIHYEIAKSLEAFIDSHYNIQITTETEVFEPVILESAEAQLLGVRSGFPALWVEAIACDAYQRPMLVRNSLLRGDRCRFYVDLTLN
jgi:GntR family transcriptional regulator